MLHRQSKSLAGLQSTLDKELSLFSAIQLTHGRRSRSQSSRKSTSSFKKHQRIFNKWALTQPKPMKQCSRSKSKGQIVSSKLSESLNLNLRYRKTTKSKHNLKKKGAVHVRSRLEMEESSLASTKCIESKSSGCGGSCQHLKLNKQYERVIEEQRELIRSLQQIIEEMGN